MSTGIRPKRAARATATGALPSAATPAGGASRFRGYQAVIFRDRRTGIVVLHWSRQIGKSYTLAAWAVDRLLSRPGRLVTVLSNSRDNGAEFVAKCAEVCNDLGKLLKDMGASVETADESPDLNFENMRMEVRITVQGRTGRIKVLAANARTARGFSGDLILDEFGFHENSAAIWEAAEPILSSNPDYLCRISSTGNGKHNMFYRMASGDGLNDGTPFLSHNGFLVSRCTRTEAWKMGVKVYDPNTRKPITPEEARAKSLDKRAYDQNYECQFQDENMTLLRHELISAAERPASQTGFICEQDWSAEALAWMRNCEDDLYAGVDVARSSDYTVISVFECPGSEKICRGILRIRDMRLPDQQVRLGEVCRLPRFRRMAIDMTGLGLGLFEYSQRAFGQGRIQGVNFSTSVPATAVILDEGRKPQNVKVTEAMAMELLKIYEDRRITHMEDGILRDDLRKPERITTPGGRVSIAATRDEAGHADHFWSFALAMEASEAGDGGITTLEGIEMGGTPGNMGMFTPHYL
jgi:phage FluMu gp28-like protein